MCFVIIKIKSETVPLGQYLHPLENSTININRGSKNFLVRKVNFEMLKQASKDHSKRKIPARNQEMLRKHEIDDESVDINSNAFQKVIV